MINQATIPQHWPFPSFQHIFSRLTHAKVYATIDLLDGFWQAPLHQDAQEYFSFATDRMVFTPNRVIQGSKNASHHFQSLICLILKKYLDVSVLIYIDDILVYAADIQTLCKILKEIL